MTRTHLDAEQTTVDARGLPCPMPVVRLAEALRDRPPGARLLLLGTDAALLTDLPAFCAATGHRLVALTEDAGCVRAWVEVAPAAGGQAKLTRGPGV
ncbi:MAG TPA: sulfurtransferase TusA family protein [Myxococcaceae bacterium]|nr:sulfurtransferase TusA family protein [Myxococcaceae bacterium]